MVVDFHKKKERSRKEIIENIPDQDIKEYFMTKFNQVLEMFNSHENQEIIQDGMSQIQEISEEFNPFQDLTLTEILIKVVLLLMPV